MNPGFPSVVSIRGGGTAYDQSETQKGLLVAEQLIFNFLIFIFFYITVMHKVLYDILSFKHFRQ